MKKINRNILWTETFFERLGFLGVKYACISPGSRNTPLTISLAKNKKIKSYVNIDERSSGFFALGLAMASRSPVLLVCTSGTAAAEFYPAIIEAYQQRVPLIVCTADRPPELIGRGANQTIYQDNIYENHIRWFINAGLPDAAEDSLRKLTMLADEAYTVSTTMDPGPVHINFPFRKPFEPHMFTDEISEQTLDSIGSSISAKPLNTENNDIVTGVKDKENLQEKLLNELVDNIKKYRKGLIVAGPGNHNVSFSEKCFRLAKILNYPVIADGTSQLRFGPGNKNNILANFEGYLRTPAFMQDMQPEIIIHFGRVPTSRGIEMYYENINPEYFIVNEFGEWFDPYHKARAVIAMEPAVFCDKLSERLEGIKNSFDQHDWLNTFLKAEEKTGMLRKEIIETAEFPFEGRIITEVLKNLPDPSSLMVSNSMPVRDLDYFAPVSEKRIHIFQNRGASGIDGITSTALGIAAAKQEPVVLITGDLAFYYDLNGLLASLKYSIPLVVVLINNNGGGIFDMLPVSACTDVFNEYFTTPHNLDFSHFVKGYGGCFENIEDWGHFENAFKKALGLKGLTVLQINTNSKASVNLRRDFWKKAGAEL